MILKEAYRYQNYLKTLLECTTGYLHRTSNILVIEQKHLRSKSQPDAQDEITDNIADRALTVPVDHIVKFGLRVLEEKEAVSAAIDAAKATYCPDVDRGLALNRVRQDFLGTLKFMASQKRKERMTSGSAYCFNGEGNQVPYRYDIRETTDLDFDRKAVKTAVDALQATCDITSNRADNCLNTVEVAFEPHYNINDSFEEEVERFSEELSK